MKLSSFGPLRSSWYWHERISMDFYSSHISWISSHQGSVPNSRGFWVLWERPGISADTAMDLRVPNMGRFSESSEDFCKLRLQQVEVSCDDNQTCTATCSSASVCFSFQCIPVLYLSWSFHLGVQPGLIFAFHSCHSCAFHGLSVLSPEVVESAVSVVWGSRLPRRRNFRRQNSKTADISGRKI